MAATASKIIMIISWALLVTTTSSESFNLDPFSEKNTDRYLPSSFIQAMADVMNKDYDDKFEIGQGSQPFVADDLPSHSSLNAADISADDYISAMTDDDNIVPSLRDIEYLQRNPLWGRQLVAGGSGEGNQRLKPAGTVGNKNEVKTDTILPAYCNPPNPCPIGYTAEDGCIEDFENTASFSRKYQAAQKCMCDTEHMFDCPSNHDSPFDNDVKRTRGIKKEMVYNSAEYTDMKFERRTAVKFGPIEMTQVNNPYLEGEKLPVAAKKGINVVNEI